MSRTEMIFVDKELRPLPFDRKVEERFAIFVRETNTHTCDFKKGANGWETVRNYISAVPFASGLTLEEASAFVESFKKKNPDCLDVRMVYVDEIISLNEWGRYCNFGILSSFVASEEQEASCNVSNRFYWDRNAKQLLGGERSSVYMFFTLRADTKQKIFL